MLKLLSKHSIRKILMKFILFDSLLDTDTNIVGVHWGFNQGYHLKSEHTFTVVFPNFQSSVLQFGMTNQIFADVWFSNIFENQRLSAKVAIGLKTLCLSIQWFLFQTLLLPRPNSHIYTSSHICRMYPLLRHPLATLPSNSSCMTVPYLLLSRMKATDQLHSTIQTKSQKKSRNTVGKTGDLTTIKTALSLSILKEYSWATWTHHFKDVLQQEATFTPLIADSLILCVGEGGENQVKVH